MNLKGAIITCLVVVLYLSFCSWRFESLDDKDTKNDYQLIINEK